MPALTVQSMISAASETPPSIPLPDAVDEELTRLLAKHLPDGAAHKDPDRGDHETDHRR